ncbi:hypothetical protein FKM82_018501 [Ascaphus truei]
MKEVLGWSHTFSEHTNLFTLNIVHAPTISAVPEPEPMTCKFRSFSLQLWRMTVTVRSSLTTLSLSSLLVCSLSLYLSTEQKYKYF